MKIKKIRSFLVGMFFLSGIFIIQGCSETAFYDDTYSFDDLEWNKGDTAVFTIDVNDTISHYDFLLTLRTTTEYQYSNLWVYIYSTAPDESTSKIAQKVPLARPDGSWMGRKSGTVVESRLRFDSNTFPLKGEYSFKIVNATRKETISNVLDIGLRIEESAGVSQDNKVPQNSNLPPKRER